MSGDGGERAATRLDGLQATLQAARKYEDDALWYRVRYTQAAARLGREPKQQARMAAVDLCAKLLDKLDEIDHWYTCRHATTELRDFLGGVAPRSLIVLASALLEEEPDEVEPTPNSKSTDPKSPNRLVSRLLGWLRPLLERLADAGEGKDHPSSDATPVDPGVLKKQLMAFANKPCDTDVSKEFHSEITHPRIVAYVIAKYESMDFYTAYNLACYYARTHEWPKVKQYLSEAAELGGDPVIKQARRDPALKTYLADTGNRAEFDKLVEGLEDDRAPSVAAGAISKDPA